MSPLANLRLQYQPVSLFSGKRFTQMPELYPVHAEVAAAFPKTGRTPVYHLIAGEASTEPRRVGVFFSGGPAAGGHNVLWGLADALPRGSELIGFVGGPQGLIDGAHKVLSRAMLDTVRNQGGFDLLGTGRTKIETEAQFEAVARVVKALKLDALVVIGGDDSNTNAAFLAERLPIAVLGVPKTIDGDLRSRDIEMTFGFDTATRTYAEAIGNICRDACSAGKYFHFIKLMGRSASHIALECALRTRPNLTLIGEERLSLNQIVDQIALWVAKRKYGVILLPEGLPEFIPGLIDTLQLETDPHGNAPVSQIATEELLISHVKQKVALNAVSHFLGYEGRCAFPTNFDAAYAYALGQVVGLAARDRLTGCIAAIRHLAQTPAMWEARMVPIVSLMAPEERKGKKCLVIQKTLVDLKGRPYLSLLGKRAQWASQDAYQYPGPIQYSGPSEVTEGRPLTLHENRTS